MADGVIIDTSQLKKFADDLGVSAPLLKKELQARLKLAGGVVATEAALISGWWSSRIPGSIRVISVGLNTVVRAGGARAPHAKYYEGPKAFRHPVFGRKDQPWVPQEARPFLMPALEREGPAVEAAAKAALDAMLLNAGFR